MKKHTLCIICGIVIMTMAINVHGASGYFTFSTSCEVYFGIVGVNEEALPTVMDIPAEEAFADNGLADGDAETNPESTDLDDVTEEANPDVAEQGGDEESGGEPEQSESPDETDDTAESLDTENPKQTAEPHESEIPEQTANQEQAVDSEETIATEDIENPDNTVQTNENNESADSCEDTGEARQTDVTSGPEIVE